MCGIFYLLGYSPETFEHVNDNFHKISGRGPDSHQFFRQKHYDTDHIVGFHRLKINDVSNAGNQPFQFDDCILVCNGEIYNHQALEAEFEITTHSKSDCEIIIHLYKLFGIDKTVKMLDGVFAFVLYDMRHNVLMAARDPYGVRPLFVGTDDENRGTIGFASEAKALCGLFPKIMPFSPAQYCIKYLKDITHIRYFDVQTGFDAGVDADKYAAVREYLTAAVKKRLMSDRPIACLLSGGLDSSLVATLVKEAMGPDPQHPLHTYSIGFEGSTDLKYARIMADFLGSKHHEVIMQYDEVVARIPEVIEVLETFDTTTIRASMGMYILAEYISRESDDIVIFSGEGADELLQGYLYFHKAPDAATARTESRRLMDDLYKFDVLRGDRTTAKHGLEIRVPFLDKKFTQLIFNLPAEDIVPQNGVEKHLLRTAFAGYMPDEILWRKKEAFSDGVSSRERSWHHVLQEAIDKVISDETFETERVKYSPEPMTKEALYYRQIFSAHYGDRDGDRDDWIGYYWMPKWIEGVRDPSARELAAVY